MQREQERGLGTLSGVAMSATESAAERAEVEEEHGVTAQIARVGYAPIVRVDMTRREVEICATSEAVDSYGTVFDYAASKDAFSRWIGNVREMHERRAVGRRVGVRFDDEGRRIFVRARISRGAVDTWEKVCDGTLRGASIGASNVTWERQMRRVANGAERALNVAVHYDLVELSLVDNPSNPDALGVTIVRDAVPDARVLDHLGPEVDETISGPDGSAVSETSMTEAGHAEVSAGQRVSDMAAPMTAFLAPHWALSERPSVPSLWQPSPSHVSAVGAWDVAAERGDAPLEEARITRVTRARGPFSAHSAGAPDMGVPKAAESRPTATLATAREQPDGAMRERLHEATRGILRSCGCPMCVAALAALGADAEDAQERATRSGEAVGMREPTFARALAAGMRASTEQYARLDDGVRSLSAAVEVATQGMATALGDLRQRLTVVEAQPLPGGPAARAVEKTHALAVTGSGAPTRAAEQLRALESLAGRLSDPQAQVAVAAELIRLQREAGGG